MTPAEMREGRHRLRQWLPGTIERIKENFASYVPEEVSALARAAMPHITIDNFEALIVSRGKHGVGWYADVALKETPPGVSNLLGTPMHMPLPTRADAVRHAQLLLDHLVGLALQQKTPIPRPVPPPVFALYGGIIELSPDLFDRLLVAMPDRVNGYGSKELAVQRIEETLAELAPDGFDIDAFNGWPQAKQIALCAILHAAALSGVLRYPPNDADLDFKP